MLRWSLMLFVLSLVEGKLGHTESVALPSRMAAVSTFIPAAAFITAIVLLHRVSPRARQTPESLKTGGQRCDVSRRMLLRQAGFPERMLLHNGVEPWATGTAPDHTPANL